MSDKINKEAIFTDLATFIDKYIHQEDARQGLYKILAHTVALNEENGKLRQDNEELRIENIRLETAADIYKEAFMTLQEE